MRSMISKSDPLEILVNKRRCGKVPLTVESDQRDQDAQVVNRQRYEPDPGVREPIAQEAIRSVILIEMTHGLASLE